MEKRTPKLRADRHDLVGIEATVGPHRERTRGGPRISTRPIVSVRMGGAPSRVGPTLAQGRAIKHLAGAAATARRG